ncbi:MAG TPA: FAD-binding and (Fe-S)-binding domain-containing protein [Anaeromyxobacteraceae bacterium]|nr:FAD-binding and (Fe-S)-binding domain-containing protein [Anaeromyxobacteraceae bacterium]
MANLNRRSDYRALPDAYRRFWDGAAGFLPAERMMCDPFRTLAFGTDASFYRLVPRVVVKTSSADEVARIVALAGRLATPVTFRAAGTSLSGQAVSDSILVVLAGGFRGCQVLDGGARIALEPGVIGAEANQVLAPYGRKIGPDPASINACMIGGIVANNAAGMCCGTALNSYQTVESMRLVLADGTLLDTSDAASRQRFAEGHPDLVAGLSAIRDEVAGDEPLTALIREKYRIKNTTGYSLNAFVDYRDPVDILVHLMVGSEGTLGFISRVTFRTVVDHPHKASALVCFPDIEQAAIATQRLKEGPVSAVELMDRASIRSVENKAGLPSYLKELGPDACALLVETRAPSPADLSRQSEEVRSLIEGVPKLLPVAFTDVRAEYEKLWDVRRGLFPAVGAARRIGTTVVIEDVAFPMRHLAAATLDLQRTMRRNRYEEGIIFGHALDGNLHFTFTQDFSTRAEVARYQALMEEVCEMVVGRYGGSLKGEHGTGRNMAPFVEREWGAKAYAIMRRVKALLDPRGILNPGVVLNDNPRVYLENLKPLPTAHDVVDRCIECGFCEPKCPSREVTSTPRQRITVQREMARLRRTGEDAARLARLEEEFRYLGDETCATDGLCATACPVAIDTGEFVKELRAASHAEAGRARARRLAADFAGTEAWVRRGLAAADVAHAVLGTRLLGALSHAARVASRGHLPQWNPHMPRPARPDGLRDVLRGRGRRVVYFPSCVARAFGPARGDPEGRATSEAMLSLLEKADYDVLFPKDVDSLCCGLAFDSKGFRDVADEKARELERALLERSEGGRIPVVCDTSPCLYRMRKVFSSGLQLLEPVEFVHGHLMDKLHFEKRPGAVAIHVTCSSTKMGLADKFRAVAEACAEGVVVPPRVGCCGFAGDRGFSHPELNASALAELRSGVAGCGEGFSNSRTCEIGLSVHGGIPYRSILFLVDRATSRLEPRSGAAP